MNRSDQSGEILGDLLKVAAAQELTRQLLEQIAEEARVQFEAEDGSGCYSGLCEEVSDAIVARLHKMGFKDAQVVYGQFEGHPQFPHTTVVVGDWEIDATRDQFANMINRREDLAAQPVLIRKRAAEPVLLSLELTCGSSQVHADEWDDAEARHLKHLEIEAWAAGQENITCDLSGTIDGDEQFSDAYLRFPPEQLKTVAQALEHIGWTGDILDVYEGQLSKDQAAAIKAFAEEQGWQTDRGFSLLKADG